MLSTKLFLYFQFEAAPSAPPILSRQAQTELWQIIAWALLLAFAFTLVFWIFRCFKKITFLQMTARFGAYLLPLAWVYGLLFDPPGNYASLDEGFFQFWLQPRSRLDYEGRLVYFLMVGLFLLPLFLFARRLQKRNSVVEGENYFKALVILSCWIFAVMTVWIFPYNFFNELVHSMSVAVGRQKYGIVGLIIAALFTSIAVIILSNLRRIR